MGGEGSWNNIPAIEFENNFLVALLDENFTKKNAYNPTILTYHFDFYISINLFLFFYWFSFSRFLPPFRFCFNKKEKHITIISTTEIFQSSTFQLFYDYSMTAILYHCSMYENNALPFQRSPKLFLCHGVYDKSLHKCSIRLYIFNLQF